LSTCPNSAFLSALESSLILQKRKFYKYYKPNNKIIIKMCFVGFRYTDLIKKLWLPTLWGFNYILKKQLNFFWNVPDYSLVVYIMVQVCTYIRWTRWQHTLRSRRNFRVDAYSHILALPTFNQGFDPTSDWALPYTIFAWTQKPKRDRVPILWRWRDSSSPQMDMDKHA
jgi:hypothetical protein